MPIAVWSCEALEEQTGARVVATSVSTETITYAYGDATEGVEELILNSILRAASVTVLAVDFIDPVPYSLNVAGSLGVTLAGAPLADIEQVFEWFERYLSRRQLRSWPSPLPSPQFVRSMLSESPISVLQNSPLEPVTASGVLSSGAVLVAGLHYAGPLAVVLVPAGLILMHVVSPVGDFVEGWLRDRLRSRD
jgi:hypothetical protein